MMYNGIIQEHFVMSWHTAILVTPGLCRAQASIKNTRSVPSAKRILAAAA
jgi:hypothetical protein